MKSNWLHFFIPHANLSKNSKIANTLIDKFNFSKTQKHAIIDSFLSLSLLLKTIFEWAKLFKYFKLIKRSDLKFSTPKYNISCWSFIEKELEHSFYGWESFNNILWLNIFEDAFKNMPKQKIGFYLCENQPWEVIFNYVWKKYNNGKLFGVLHGTNRRFWEVSNYFDKRVFTTNYPLPNYILVNGQLAYNEFIELDYPCERIIKAEALRYNDYSFENKKKIINSDIVDILILGDINPNSTNKMMQLLESSLEYINVNINFSLKSHPNYNVNTKLYSSLNLTNVIRPIGELVSEFDLVITTNQTSASIDVYLCGMPIVVLYDENELNYSPLRNIPDVKFVSSAIEIGNLINSKKFIAVNNPVNLFYVDSKLKMWEDLLSKIKSNQNYVQ